MSITLNSATNRTFRTNRNPTSSDYLINVDQVGDVIPEIGNYWENTANATQWQCKSITPSTSVSWIQKPNLEEGSFVPVLTFGGQTTGITYSANGQAGLWTQIGNTVYINAFINLNDKGTATGNAIITGLPFSARSSIQPKGLDVTKAYIGISVGFNNMNARINSGENQIRLVETSDVVGTGVQNVTDALFANNSIIQVDGFYFI